MLRFAVFLLAAGVSGAQALYELSGRVLPEGEGSVTLFGASQPFTTSTLSDDEGRFTFKKLRPAAYTISVFVPGQGEARQTIEVGPGSADKHNRVHITLRLSDASFDRSALNRQHAVSTRQLSIPDKAVREYLDAQHDLEKHDAAAAEKRLEHAVELAPQFATAWNNLGTIAYQTRRFPLAEERFREALRQDPSAYEPLVNLGGVLVTLHKLDEALEVNVHATLVRPNDALAHSQLGQAYFGIGQYDDAVKHLERARSLDPAHFSHPQLVLAEIYLRRGDPRAAADVLEDFLRYHPDYPQAAKMREQISEWRQ
jgi:tetratricopeptide (TPR) repeat protein